MIKGEYMDKNAMLQLLTSLAEGIAKTFGKNCETLIQDLSLRDHPILAIFNGQVTGRQVGSTEDVFGSTSQSLDPKLLQRDWINMMVIRGNQKIKSTTMIVRGDDYCYGLCINLDVTLNSLFMEQLSEQMNIDSYLDSALASAKQVRLEEIFDACVEELGIEPSRMKKADRIAIVTMLKRHHALDYQRAVPFISEKLGVSRYTIYNYLKLTEEKMD